MDPEELRRDVQTLRDLLEAGGARFRPLALEADTRPHVKVFWETLGWSDDLAGDLVEPSYDVARARARERLQDWQLSRMAKLLVEDLPERFRVVEDDGQGVGFILALCRHGTQAVSRLAFHPSQ